MQVAALDEGSLRRVDEWAGANEIACLFYLASADDPESHRVAEDGGFRLVDLRTELRREAGEEAPPESIRAVAPDDREPLVEVARTSHRITRFYVDPGFPDERCHDFYETWLVRSLDGWADQVLTSGEVAAPSGYVSCHLDEEAERGSIGLIAVAPHVRRSGVGLELTRGAVAWCSARGARELVVVAQGRNVAALRTFERAGFRMHSVGLWFHKWYRP